MAWQNYAPGRRRKAAGGSGEKYGNEKIVLQGAIDCMFEEDGKMVVVDYKTDRAKDPLKLAEMYKEQLRLYKLAVEQITGKSVGQCLLYSFAMSCEVMV